MSIDDCVSVSAGSVNSFGLAHENAINVPIAKTIRPENSLFKLLISGTNVVI